MKLYTEEQVKRAMLHSYLTGVERPDDYLPIEDSILQELTPIELPSDEEMERNMNLLLRWVLKHYETHTDENGMFCWVSSNGYEFDCIDVIKDYINQNETL